MRLSERLALTVCALATSNAWGGGAQRYVVIDRGAGLDQIESEAAANGGGRERRLTYHQATAVTMSEAAAAALDARFGSSVEIELDGVASANGKPTPSAPPAESTPWGISFVNAPTAWSTTRGSGIVVCVVDTGIQSTHSDLSANVIGGENFVLSRGSVDPNKWEDDNGHGTHVAGTIAAIDNEIGVVGVAPEASLFAAKVLDRRGSGYNSDVADGISSCVANGARVINMSLGSSSSSSLIQTAVQDAAAAGVVLVAAAGNDYGGAVSYPAAYPEVLAVSAVDSAGALASYSNVGPEVDYAAPGSSVYSTYKGGAYATLSGTSMATPHVSGVAALWLAAGSLGIVTNSLGLTAEQEGLGLPDASATVVNF